MRVLSRLFLLLCALLPASVAADDPPRAAVPEKVFSSNRQFSALVDPVAKVATVYRETRSPQKRWEMPANFTNVLVSDDGRHLVAYHRGGNVLDLSHAPDEIVLSFYDRGRLLTHVRLNEIIRDADLVRTQSHHIWAVSFGFVSAQRFRVETADHRVHTFNVTTGKPTRTRSQP